MRRLVLFMTFATALAMGQSTPGPQLPRKTPEFVVNLVDGQQRLLSSLRGKTVVIAFLFTICPHCQKTADVLEKVQEEYAEKGVQVLSVSFDQGAQSRVKEFSEKLNLHYPCGYSTQNQVLEFLQIPINEPYFVPALVFIDRSGTIRSEYVGDDAFLSRQEINIRAELEKILHGGAVPVVKTPPKS